MEARLVVVDGKQSGKSIPLPETIFLIGRAPQCHLRPHCPSVSKLHCAIAAWAGKVRVRDLKSRNGTLLNGQAIDGEAVVHDGDRLQVGSLRFTFSIKHKDGSPLTSPVDERDVKWLLEAPEDSEALSVGRPTRIMSPDDEESEKLAAASASSSPSRKRPSKVVSAGQHLRDYFQQRKNPPAIVND
jgi:pSer/pThr/pTyr-binding forkhead associated (FHA) protein